MKRLLFFALLCANAVALAQTINLPDLSHARGIGMGGAFRGTGLGADSINGNPASIALIKTFQTELSGTFDIPSKDGYGSVAIRDSQTSELAAGIGYHFLALGGLDNRSWGHLNTLALALPLADALVIGVAGNYLYQTGGHHVNAATFDAGAVVRPFGGFLVGVSANNIIDTRQAELARYYTGSLAYLGPNFTIAGDIRSTLRQDNGAPTLNVGGEVFIGQIVFLRAGYSHDFLQNGNFVTGGAGVFSQGAGVDVAYRHEFGGNGARLLALTLRLQL
jgi:hypothetical protein